MPALKITKTLDDTRTFITMVAKKQGWKLNPDEGFITLIVEGLTINYNRYGYYNCPCRDTWNDRNKDKDIMCPCAYCVPDQKDFGHCYCGLYLTPKFLKTGKKPKSLPERRPANLSP
jgi:ferredoxin-thioredoxin reductase catalytic chain